MSTESLSPESLSPGALTSVHLTTLGCARNEVDSEELAARLAEGGFRLVDDPQDADAVMVNTCGFIESAKKDSVDTLLAAADLKADGRAQAVVAVGCMAERYGKELADSLPEADAVLGFDDYDTIADKLNAILAGERHQSHVPTDRRKLLPISPVERRLAEVSTPGMHTAPGGPADLPAGVAPASGPRTFRRRLGSGPSAPLKMAAGCDRRCTFCAIPRFRGAYVSRTPDEIVAEARWLAGEGVREVFLVSENSSSYGKDLGDIRLLEKLLGQLSELDELDWIRVSYLQPAEMRPDLVDVMTSTPKVVPYFDLSFQHASAPVLRRMRRFGDPDSFLNLIESIRERAPQAGIRSNVIVGFPGETEQDVRTLADFLSEARLDAIGVFGYSDETETEAYAMAGKLDEYEIEGRRAEIADLAEELVDQRAEERIGERVSVLVESVEDGGDDPSTGRPEIIGRAEHQGPEVDGTVRLIDSDARSGDLVEATVTGVEGVDLVASVRAAETSAGPVRAGATR
ncbi:30S ribosomal protein S12 methylthiotransferase RimO [Microlunatus elymi]|uniref:Ribosomal protein uS12 methylthiotransferase RimO n=1 Tax=Microlunatus elymi TaxID=2596828 RepID=A0A516Q189_9ACTN|nr:30S ribosomal protein S12 methylthiotransferase RimO [Microlunatus elymi]QDP97209.1 30S ribosomal protein S12 methylthiotransferase RimO [Microlunatus elymi]